jgi:hypothetical protein
MEKNLTELNLIINALLKYEEEIYGRVEQKKSEFEILKERIENSLKNIRLNLKNKEESKKTSEKIKISKVIKNEITQSKLYLKDLSELISKKTDNANEIKILKIYEGVLKKLESILEPNEKSDDQEFKINFEMAEGIDVEEHSLNEEEKEVLKRWKDKDEKIEEYLDYINENLIKLDEKFDVNSEILNKNNELVKNIQIQANKVDKELDTQNERLKKVITNFRAPSKICMDACLIILIFVLLTILIQQIAKM